MSGNRPDGRRIVLHANSIEIGLTVTLADGTSHECLVRKQPRAKIGKLSPDTHEPGKGTWHLADFIGEGGESAPTFAYKNRYSVC